MSNFRKKKIIWALDPYGEAKIQSSAAELAKVLNKKIDIEVVYVHGQSDFLVESDEKSIRTELSEAEEKLEKILKTLKFKSQRQPKVLMHKSEFVRKDVKTLVNYTKKQKGDLVLASSNARKGLIQQALGSFAETLMLASSIPTMIVNSKAKINPRAGTILFPTDFSRFSWKAFQKAVDFAKVMNTPVQIFHQYQNEEDSKPKRANYFQNDQWLEDDHLLDDSLKNVKINLNKWLSFAKKQNIKCNYIIKVGTKNIADATLELAKKERPWMIAMATVTGPIADAFIGRNARWIVRSAKCPVWVLYIEGK